MATILGVDVLVVFAAIVWFSAWLMLAIQAILTRREVRAIMERVEPLLVKADVVMSSFPDLNKLADLEMIPGTIVAGIKTVLKEQLETQGSPLRAYTSALITEGSTALAEIFSKRFEAVAKILPAAQTILAKSGGEGRADKIEGRAAVEAMLERFGPFKGVITKYLPKSSLEDPVVFLNTLGSMKKAISSFAPGVGAQIDGMIEQMLLGEVEPNAFPGVGGLVKFLPKAGTEGSSVEDAYGR